MNLRPLLFAFAIIAPIANAWGNDVKSFDHVTKKISSTLNCRESSIFGNIYGCILGRRETVRVFAERHRREPTRVLNIRFVWQDYHRDVGVPLHADARAAKRALTKLTNILAPRNKDFVLNLFTKGEGKWSHDGINISVDKGPTAYTREAIFR
jgi:hypothetical protein